MITKKMRNAVLIVLSKNKVMYCEKDSFDGVYDERATFFDDDLAERYLRDVADLSDTAQMVVVRTATKRVYGCQRIGPGTYKKVLEAAHIDRAKDITSRLFAF